MLDRGFFIHHLAGYLDPRTLNHLCIVCRAFRDWIDCDEFGRAFLRTSRYCYGSVVDRMKVAPFVHSKKTKWQDVIIRTGINLVSTFWTADDTDDCDLIVELHKIPRYKCPWEWFHACLSHKQTAHLALERYANLQSLVISEYNARRLILLACRQSVYPVVDSLLDNHPIIKADHSWICQKNIEYVFRKVCHINVEMFLHDAIFWGHERLVKYILDNHADVVAECIQDKYHMAVRLRRIPVVTILYAHIGSIRSAKHPRLN